MAKLLAAGIAIVVILIMSISGAAMSVTVTPVAQGAEPSTEAIADIPANYLAVYLAVGKKKGLDWAILAAIGKIETDHGRLNAPGVTSGTNAFGAAGPCQFLLSTWAKMGHGNVYDFHDCIPAMADYLALGGAPEDYNAAIFSYNHANWYVTKVLAQAEIYRGALAAMPSLLVGSTRARIVAIAKSTLTTRTGHFYYSMPGALTTDPTPAPPARSDCSQWARAIYLLAGVPDPGITTYDQINHGHQVAPPLPGDLVSPQDEGPVETYVGGGRTIGHGTPPIDYANVSDFPGASFMRDTGVD